MDDGAGELSAAFIRQAAVSTEASESYRFEMRFGWNMSDLTFELNVAPDTPIMTGAFSGQASTTLVDLGPFFEELFSAFETEAGGNKLFGGDLFGGDLTIQTVEDGAGHLYLKAPIFAALAGEAGVPAEFSGLSDGWAVIDLALLEDFGADQLGRGPDRIVAGRPAGDVVIGGNGAGPWSRRRARRVDRSLPRHGDA